MQRDSEPSVEEILESIKRVIARDNRERADNVRRQRGAADSENVLDEDDGGDVLELDAEDVLAEVETAMLNGDGGLLTNEGTARAMRESFSALSMLAEPGAAPQIVRSGETSLEGLTRDLLRPMLAEWLDRNLPALVERLVKAEIARIAGKKG
jgi:cell pole-organizing protein PopZ